MPLDIRFEVDDDRSLLRKVIFGSMLLESIGHLCHPRPILVSQSERNDWISPSQPVSTPSSTGPSSSTVVFARSVVASSVIWVSISESQAFNDKQPSHTISYNNLILESVSFFFDQMNPPSPIFTLDRSNQVTVIPVA